MKRLEEHLKLKYYYYDQITKYLEDAGFSIEEEYFQINPNGFKKDNTMCSGLIISDIVYGR